MPQDVNMYKGVGKMYAASPVCYMNSVSRNQVHDGPKKHDGSGVEGAGEGAVR
jgi:hypothetical protein